jgi:hypothetical protein
MVYNHGAFSILFNPSHVLQRAFMRTGTGKNISRF